MKSNASLHQQLQNRILYVCNLSIIILLIVLAVITSASNQSSLAIVSIAGVTVLSISLFMQYLGYFVVASYITTYTLSFAAMAATLGRSEITADLIYLFITYQIIPLALSGILAQNRLFTVGVSGTITLFFAYLVVSIQGPAIGLNHVVQIAGGAICIIVISLLSDQTYLLSGKMIGLFNNELLRSSEKDRQINEIIKIYNNNKQAGEQLKSVTIDNDTLAGQLNELSQKFSEDMHTLHQILKDIHIRSDNVTSSSSNILKVFTNHKDNIVSYKEKIENIADTSQEIDYIIQDRKVQMNDIIDLSTKGGMYMQDSITAVEKVSDNTKSMVDMISLIMEVAEKTNILALNAAVEASRAGKYGGGFAIVAKEIKALSTETTQNADTINRSLQNNIATISEAVNTIKNVGQSFTQLNTSVIEFSSAIDQIVVKINNLTQQNSQMSIETKNTLSLITEVQNVITKTIQSMEQGQQKVSSIYSLSNTIDKDISQINQTTSSIGDSGRKIQEKFREYYYSVQKVEGIIDEINKIHSQV